MGTERVLLGDQIPRRGKGVGTEIATGGALYCHNIIYTRRNHIVWEEANSTLYIFAPHILSLAEGSS